MSRPTTVLPIAAAGVLGAVLAGFAQVPVGQSPPAPANGPGLVSPSSTPSGLVVGQVVDGVTGRPIADAIVAINSPGARGTAVPVPGRGTPAPGRASVIPQRVLVDSQGRFVFRDLPAGAVALTATKSGYFGGASGQLTPRGQGRPIDLADAEKMGGVTLRLWPFGVVSGAVTDDTGAPVSDLPVQLLKRSALNGRWQFTPVGQSSTTDDRGTYRVGSLMPGDYLVAIRSDGVTGEKLIMSLAFSDESVLTKILPKLMERGEESLLIDPGVHLFPTTFFPGAPTSAQASTISIEPGTDRGGIDFRLKASAARIVTGSIDGIPDRSTVFVNLRLRSADAMNGGVDLNPPSASMDQNGRFVFMGVAAGEYVLDALARPRNNGVPNPTPLTGRGGAPGEQPASPAPEAPMLLASMPISVSDKNMADVVVTVHPAGRVTGHVDFDVANRPASDTWTRIFVGLESLDGPTAGPLQPGRVESDGTFRTGSAPPGRYVLRVGTLTLRDAAAGATPVNLPPPAGAQTTVWRPRSAMINGRDALDQPIELTAGDASGILITFTDKALGSVSGVVRDSKGDADPQAVVLAFPVDNRLWNDLGNAGRRIRTARTSRYGNFSLSLPGGDYFLVVGTDEQLLDIQAPGALDALSRLASRVVIIDGQTKTMDLKGGGR